MFFRRSLTFSLLGHLTLFSVFGLSFGGVIPRADYAQVDFWGGVLSNFEITGVTWDRPLDFRRTRITKPELARMEKKLRQDKIPDLEMGMTAYSFKPPAVNLAADEKIIYSRKVETRPESFRNRDSVVTFHPVLPYHFTLYFKDRQVANIELMYNLLPRGSNRLVEIRRKISSGNLEVDLLTMRYISHYLFIQRDKLTPGTWKKVKIEFSPRND